jgi:predicted alpha/beta superfamily hydrolase
MVKKISILLFLTFAATQISASADVRTIEIVDITSALTGNKYQLLVSLPDNYGKVAHQYPAILLLDANYFYRNLENAYDSLASQRNEDFILIGINFDPEPVAKSDFLRDFVPNPMPKHPNAGHAAEFKEVLEKELIPYCLGNYTINSSKLSIVGHHISAGFLVWLLSQKHKPFANYVVCNPALDLFELPKPTLGASVEEASGIFIGHAPLHAAYFETNEKVSNETWLEWIGKITSVRREGANLMVKSYQIDKYYADLLSGFYDGLQFVIEGNRTSSGRVFTSPTKQPVFPLQITSLKDMGTGNRYEISYYREEGQTPMPLPAVVILDADFNFLLLVNEYRALREKAEVPEMLLVGVGYGTTILGLGNNREIDFLPKYENSNTTHFAHFINEQLIGQLKADFNIDTTRLVITGHSYGGTFVTQLLSQKSPFTDYIITAPNLLPRFITKPADLLPARLNQNIYLACGLLDGNKVDARKLDKVIAPRVVGRYQLSLDENEDHTSETPKAFSNGLRFLLGLKQTE